jgi:hypothetical protein
MSRQRRDLTCVQCGQPTREGFYHHAGASGHGVSGWPSDEPLCLACMRIAIWGSAEPPLKRRRKGVNLQ